MKLLTKEQEQAHYNATLQGGLFGGSAGLALGGLGVLAASRRYQFFRQLTLPLKAFLITSSGTFAGIVSADHASRSFEREQNPIDREFDARQREQAEAAKAGKTFTQRAMEFGKQERYKIVGASWIASMIAAFAIVNRNKYMTGQQKLVQARVYAQFLTLGVLIATAAFEISDRNNEEGRYETIKVIDPSDPEHKRMIEKRRYVGGDSQSDGDSMWKEMIAAEEERMKEREQEEKEMRAKHKKKNDQQQQQSKKKQADKDKDKDKDSKNSQNEKSEDKKSEGESGGDGEGESNTNTKSDSNSNSNSSTKHAEKHEESEKQKKIPSANQAKNNK